MKTTFLLLFFSILNVTFNQAQTIQQLSICDSATIVLTEKIKSFGPKGNSSYGFGSMEYYDNTSLSFIPELKNLPDTLSNLKKFCIYLDNFQFYFQNYKNGKSNKEFFMDMAKNSAWNLSDTVYMTSKPLKNTIFIVAGYNAANTAVYIIDANNNYDFSDDTLRYLYADLYAIEDVLNNSYYVDYETYDGKKIQNNKILINVRTYRGNEEQLNLSFSFPELMYTKISYANKVFLVCKETFNQENTVYVLEDQPFFSAIGNKYEVKPNQYIKLGDEYYLYMPDRTQENIVKIKRAIISENLSNGQNSTKSEGNTSIKPIPTSNQLGMIAPPIKGINIYNDSTISLQHYKGKYVFLDFWATYCGPCILEFPYLAKVYDELDRSVFEIIGIVNDGTKERIIKIMDDKKVKWPNISINEPYTELSGYNIKSFPTTYLLDPEGIIIAVNLRGEELMHRLKSLNLKRKL